MPPRYRVVCELPASPSALTDAVVARLFEDRPKTVLQQFVPEAVAAALRSSHLHTITEDEDVPDASERPDSAA